MYVNKWERVDRVVARIYPVDFYPEVRAGWRWRWSDNVNDVSIAC
jgi:hypothetical protein